MTKVALVVDDSMLIRYTVCRFLQDHGYVVETAGNGSEALEVLARVHPDLIVTDMHMPRMSGSELITALKSKPALPMELPTPPILIMFIPVVQVARASVSKALSGRQ